MDSVSTEQLLGEQADIEERFRADARIVLYPGDVNELLPTIPDESIKLVVTSPPYNVGKEYERRVGLQAYLDEQEATIRELHRVLREDGSICWEVGNYVQDGEDYPLDIYFYPLFKKLGMYLRNRIVWRSEHGLHATRRFSGRYETILWFTKSDRYTFNLDSVRVPSKYPGKRSYKGPNKGKPSGNPNGKNPSNVWEVLTQEWEGSWWEIPNVKAAHRERTGHPTQYPIELVERCVLALTNEGDWVFDPYVGVGTSMIAAVKRNRRGMGAEKEASYVALARQRIEQYFMGVLPYRELGTPIRTPLPGERVAQVPLEWIQPSLPD